MNPISIQTVSNTRLSKRKLVMGVAWGLNYDQLLLFSRSLRRVTTDVDIVLLAKEVETPAKQLAVKEQIQLLPLTSCYYSLRNTFVTRTSNESFKRIRNYLGFKLVRGMMAVAYPLMRAGYTADEYRELRREVNKLVINTHSSRFLQYVDFLKNQGVEYDKIMLTDVRDVCFQADPFARIPADQLWMFQEQGPETLGSQPRNRRWVEATFGRKVLRQIAHQPIICSGVTIGGAANILGYLDAMEPELIKRTPIYIPDQGIHNAMAYTGAFDHLHPVIVKNGDGPVLTVGLMTEAQFQWNAAGQLVDAAGVPYAVIHQFDRHPKLVAAFQKLAT